MGKAYLFLLTIMLVIYSVLLVLNLAQVPARAQEVFRSNTVCTKVGNAKDSDKPPACSGPANFQYYCQSGPGWGGECGLTHSGCGPTSFAMIVSSFGAPMMPPQVDQIFQNSGYRSCGGGSDGQSAINNWLVAKMGFTKGPELTTAVNGTRVLNLTLAKQYLDVGYLIIGSSDNYPCGASCDKTGEESFSHIFVIDKVSISANTVDVRDPSNCQAWTGYQEDPSKRIHPNSGVLNFQTGGFSWLYAYPVKR